MLKPKVDDVKRLCMASVSQSTEVRLGLSTILAMRNQAPDTVILQLHQVSISGSVIFKDVDLLPFPRVVN